MDTVIEERFADIDQLTALWRQGDCFIGSHEFIFQTNPNHHISSEENLAEEDTVLFQDTLGFCVISQTCDITRSCKDRHYLEVSPLVHVTSERLLEIEKGKRPSYGFIPNIKEHGLVADLDRVMTIEKSCLKGLKRTEGCVTDNQRLAFAQCLVRKRARFAFPDEFNFITSDLQDRMIDKHKKESPEGQALRALKEIRVFASPSWDAEQVSVHFFFIRDALKKDFKGTDWDTFLTKWLSLIEKTPCYHCVTGEITTMEILSAEEYVTSAQLDLDHLSRKNPS